MALTPTIYKFSIDLSDLDQNRYESLDLVVAKHPSETAERMFVRVLAYCINAEERLAFGKGISDADEPDLWLRTRDDQISLWIDVGEPKIERIVKASRLAGTLKVYSFNTRSAIWWSSIAERCQSLNVEAYRVNWTEVQAATTLLDRTMQMSVTISERSAFIATARGECEVNWVVL